MLIKDRCFSKAFTDVSDRDIYVVKHVRKTVWFNKDSTWLKQADAKSSFDVVMTVYDSSGVSYIIALTSRTN